MFQNDSVTKPICRNKINGCSMWLKDQRFLFLVGMGLDPKALDCLLITSQPTPRGQATERRR